jgi:hypothetical protein
MAQGKQEHDGIISCDPEDTICTPPALHPVRSNLSAPNRPDRPAFIFSARKGATCFQFKDFLCVGEFSARLLPILPRKTRISAGSCGCREDVGETSVDHFRVPCLGAVT